MKMILAFKWRANIPEIKYYIEFLLIVWDMNIYKHPWFMLSFDTRIKKANTDPVNYTIYYGSNSSNMEYPILRCCT